MTIKAIPLWEQIAIAVLWLWVLWEVIRGLKKDSEQPMPEEEDEDLP